MRDAPWNPWTIPNAISFVRLALIPVFLVLAFSSDEGTDALPAILFAAVAWGDYVDGIAARVTGQYSKLGTVLDPVIDRALIIAGVAVVWNFETLPRWALAVLAVREVVQIVYGNHALRQGVDLYVNWPGRIAVWPIMSAIFFALVGEGSMASWMAAIMVIREFAVTEAIPQKNCATTQMNSRKAPRLAPAASMKICAGGSLSSVPSCAS